MSIFHRSSTLFFLLVIFFGFSACNFIDLNSELQGSWHIINANRNGRITSTFENGYIKFWHGDSLETNITGDLIKTDYKLRKKMVLSDGILPDLNVISIEQDTITVQFIIDGTHFHLVMVKNRS